MDEDVVKISVFVLVRNAEQSKQHHDHQLDRRERNSGNSIWYLKSKFKYPHGIQISMSNRAEDGYLGWNFDTFLPAGILR